MQKQIILSGVYADKEVKSFFFYMSLFSKCFFFRKQVCACSCTVFFLVLVMSVM